MKRIINISTHSYVSMQQGLMSIQNMDSKESALVPIREINTIVFENPATVVTTRLLAELANAGITALFCGANHMPAGMEIPLQSNLNSASISEHQFNAPKPLIKRLWKSLQTTPQTGKPSLQSNTSQNSSLKEADGIRTIPPL